MEQPIKEIFIPNLIRFLFSYANSASLGIVIFVYRRYSSRESQLTRSKH